ncbi:MAG: hypothetical protein IJ038_00570 [Clostridia bacterium]|nr:hypothetical protein [Clostridia bacterium]
MKQLQTNKSSRILSALLLLLLTAAIAFSAVGCDNGVRGEGDKEFLFKVVTADGTTKEYTVRTDKETVGEALLDEGLIAGEDGAYGLYVKTVDGETHEYETDGTYWAFYIGDDYAMTGVDATDIEEGKIYSFKAEKG